MIDGTKSRQTHFTSDVRSLYSYLLYLLLPGVLMRLWWKGRRLPAYRQHWGERLARQLPQGRDVLWIHAVSVGEVRAAAPLVDALMARNPGRPVLLTTTTPTGRETVAQLYGERVECVYLPYDLPGAAARFIDAIKPRLAVFMEVELWPNLFARLGTQRVPLYLVNARLSAGSFNGYRNVAPLTRRTLSFVTAIAAQTREDRQRFITLGAAEGTTTVSGNLKFDAGLPGDYAAKKEALAQRLNVAGRRLWVAGSTHAGEERAILEAHRAVIGSQPNALLILAPRHPERAAAVAKLCGNAGLNCRMLGSEAAVDPACQVLIVDRIGVLVYLYGIAGAAFIGGSLVDAGGHNPVEAILAGAPVISGHYDGNFADVYSRLRECQAARFVMTSQALSETVLELLSDKVLRASLTDNAQGVIETSRGTLNRTLALITADEPPQKSTVPEGA